MMKLGAILVALFMFAAARDARCGGFDVPDMRYGLTSRLDVAPAPTPTPPSGWFDVKGAVVMLHYIKSGWKTPQLALAEFVLGPHIGGLYVCGVGLREVQGFGSVVPVLSYVGQGKIPKLSFLQGITATLAVANQGVFSGKPAYLFGVGVSTK